MSPHSLPLLLGEAPSRTGDRYWRFPLSGNPARVLCQLAGIQPGPNPSVGDWYWALLERFDTLNAIERHADAYPWSAAKARERVSAYLREHYLLGEQVVVIALGRNAASAVYDDPSRDFCEWSDRHTIRSAIIPHPSGLNRLLNDPIMRGRAGEILRQAMACRPNLEVT